MKQRGINAEVILEAYGVGSREESVEQAVRSTRDTESGRKGGGQAESSSRGMQPRGGSIHESKKLPREGLDNEHGQYPRGGTSIWNGSRHDEHKSAEGCEEDIAMPRRTIPAMYSQGGRSVDNRRAHSKMRQESVASMVAKWRAEVASESHSDPTGTIENAGQSSASEAKHEGEPTQQDDGGAEKDDEDVVTTSSIGTRRWHPEPKPVRMPHVYKTGKDADR